jgi:hypothetical protein
MLQDGESFRYPRFLNKSFATHPHGNAAQAEICSNLRISMINRICVIHGDCDRFHGSRSIRSEQARVGIARRILFLRSTVTVTVARAASGEVNKFEDLPPALRGNVDVINEPLTRKEGATPAWTDAESDDVIAFLQTLSGRDVVRGAKDR